MNADLLTQNRLLHEEIRRRIDQISAINTVAATVGQSLNLDRTLNTALEIITQIVGAEAAGISLIDHDAKEVVLRAQLGWIHDFVKDSPMRIPMGKGMSGEVIMNDKTIVHHDLTPDEDFAVPRFGEEHFRSIVMAPMHARGQIIGILSIMSHQPNQFDDALIGVLNSIADTVGVSLENARLHEQHVENENRLTAILNSTADGIIATDQDSRISWVNYTAAEMLDVTTDQLIGIPLREADIQVLIREELLKALQSASDDDQRNFRVHLEPNRELSVQVSPVRVASQLVNLKHSMDGWVIVLQDITHIRESEIARAQFIQAAAHDMKNPLSVTQSSITMLSGMIDTSDTTTQEVLEIAGTSIDRVRRLIDDLLQIEKIESGYEFNREEVDLREMVYEIGAQTTPLMQSKTINFSISFDDDVPVHIVIDREWVGRALYNYLENASKYSQVNGHVTFQVSLQFDWLHFDVVDDGPGIPKQVQSRLFDRFYRVQDRRDIRGSGLGLAIVKSVAEAHGGQVYVKSREGNGSCFGIALPLNEIGG